MRTKRHPSLETSASTTLAAMKSAGRQRWLDYYDQILWPPLGGHGDQALTHAAMFAVLFGKPTGDPMMDLFLDQVFPENGNETLPPTLRFVRKGETSENEEKKPSEHLHSNLILHLDGVHSKYGEFRRRELLDHAFELYRLAVET